MCLQVLLKCKNDEGYVPQDVLICARPERNSKVFVWSASVSNRRYREKRNFL